jgi:predicted O-linked N-acetylglucosamine transferase (SPINDLY family)
MSDALQSTLQQGLEAHGAGRLADAEAAYRAVLASEPENFDALHLLGVVHAQRGQPAEAAKLIEAALAIDGADARALNNYGLALLELNRAGEALAQFDKAVALESTMASAHNHRGRALRALARWDDALLAADRAIALKTDFLEAVVNRATILQDMGRYGEALAMADKAVSLAPNTPAVHTNRALLLMVMGRPRDALASYDRAIATKPDHVLAQCGRGTALLAMGRADDALAVYERILSSAPQTVEAHAGKGVVLLRMQRYDDALAAFDAALRVKPDFAPAIINQGNALRAMRRFDEALVAFERAVAADPLNLEAANNRAVTLKDVGRPEEALTALESLLTQQPSNPILHHNRGLVLQGLGRLDEAVIAYNVAIAVYPTFAQAFSDRAAALIDLERWNEAAASAGQAIALDASQANAHYNHGTALQRLNRWDDALADFDAALRLKPDYPAAHNNRAVVLQLLDRRKEARDGFDAAVALNPALSEAACAGFTISNQICDWNGIAARRADILNRVRLGQVTTPPAVFAAADDADAHKRSAEGFALSRAAPEAPLAQITRMPHTRIRVGYVSSDFFYHATAQLMAEVFEKHDRERFEIYAIALNASDNSPLRNRLEAAIEHFEECGHLSDLAVATRMAELEIDIAVDLKGYTKDCRPHIFSFRPAPVSTAYLGYPGTTGSPNIDYLIADSYLIPPEQRGFYSEKIVTLPGCYQANDSKKIIGATPSRSELKLPDDAFVFCAFNGSYKITPEIFDLWMRLLKAVPKSVLWLYADSTEARENLAGEAVARGVPPGRIVFAEFAALPEHLGRLKAADLFLDTFPICGHTTASDCLWAGVPLLTREGKSFVARVAGSLLSTIGVPELIAKDLADYEAKAVKLAKDKKLLAGLREKIAKGRETSPLFDAESFTRGLESAYRTMWDAHLLGVEPRDFAVAG